MRGQETLIPPSLALSSFPFSFLFLLASVPFPALASVPAPALFPSPSFSFSPSPLQGLPLMASLCLLLDLSARAGAAAFSAFIFASSSVLFSLPAIAFSLSFMALIFARSFLTSVSLSIPGDSIPFLARKDRRSSSLVQNTPFVALAPPSFSIPYFLLPFRFTCFSPAANRPYSIFSFLPSDDCSYICIRK